MKPFKEEFFLVSDPGVPFTAFINRDVDVNIHWHSYMELLYVIQGQAIIWIENQKYDFAEGDFLIITPQESHRSQSIAGQNAEILVIQFEPAVIHPSLESLPEAACATSFFNPQHERCMHIVSESDMDKLLKEILFEFNNKLPGYAFHIRGNIYKMLALLLRDKYFTQQEPEGSHLENMQKLQQLLEYVHHNYANKIDNQTAASMMCMSYHHFSRFFHKTCGKTFTEYIQQYRIHEAEKLLMMTNRGIDEIAFTTGFPSTTYFCRLFKRITGFSPVQFKKAKSDKN